MISNSISKVIDPLASRCLCINVKSPNINDIIDYTFHIARLENITITLDGLSYITSKYNGNIKNVLWILQIFKINEHYINNITDYFDELKILFQKKGRI
jgi:DNA polymerase III delta prime subunit